MDVYLVLCLITLLKRYIFLKLVLKLPPGEINPINLSVRCGCPGGAGGPDRLLARSNGKSGEGKGEGKGEKEKNKSNYIYIQIIMI
jgi:hypothetical protein